MYYSAIFLLVYIVLSHTVYGLSKKKMPYLHLIDEAIGLLNTEIRLIEWRIKIPGTTQNSGLEKQSLSNNRFPTKNREHPYPVQYHARHGIFAEWLLYFR